MAFDPQTRLLAGSHRLAPLLNYAGFGYVPGCIEEGGYRVCGRFIAGDRVLELVYRWGLAEVNYSVGKLSMSHAEYMDRLGVADKSVFLSEQHDISCEGFDGLYADLRDYCSDFLAGDASEFAMLAQQRPYLRIIA